MHLHFRSSYSWDW